MWVVGHGWPERMDAMARMLQADERELVRRLQGVMSASISQVMAVVNAARDGHLIDDSEVQVNDLMNDLKRRVYEEALQTRVDATEASFSPSGPGDGQASGEQGPRQRVASGVAGSGGDQSQAL